MPRDSRINTVIIIIVVLVIIYIIYQSVQKPQQVIVTEKFDSNSELDNFYQTQNSGIDAIECDPSCCGFGDKNWSAPFEGLTADQIKQSIISKVSASPSIRSNYTCANGPNGVGCPCFDKNTYNDLVNRGAPTNQYSVPTGNIIPNTYQPWEV